MDKTLKFLSDHAFGVYMNANDTFGYACSDEERIDIYDVPKLMEMEEKYGGSGINAFLAVSRKRDVIEPLRTENYHKAKKELKETYTFCEYLDPWNKEQWNAWWKEYVRLTGDTEAFTEENL